MIKRTFIKILGPPTIKAIRELEKIAVEMPEFCIMNTIISTGIPSAYSRDIGGEKFNRGYARTEYALNYFKSSGVVLNKEQCERILSGHPTLLGEYDFFFEWNKEFNPEDFEFLVKKIDEALAPLGCLYTITNK